MRKSNYKLISKERIFLGEDNPFIDFYGKHHVSPVRQNIENFNLHMQRREKLYRSLGMPPVLFSNKRILEVGPGGGYNSLAFLRWGANMDFVEPNPKAQEEIEILLAQHEVDKRCWTLFPYRVEEYDPGITYDIIIAEGFLPGISNQAEVIGKLSKLINPGGVISVTCIDDVSFFFENVKRVIAWKLIQGIEDFDVKVKVLSQAFESHLLQLKHASRLVEDWVVDQFLNPALYGELFSMEDCIHAFGSDFEVLGSSPQIFTDFSWYKNIDFDSKNHFLQQFSRKRHSLILVDVDDHERTIEENKKLVKAIADFRNLSKVAEINNEETYPKLLVQLQEIRDLSQNIDKRIPEIIDEAIKLLSQEDLTVHDVAKATKLAGAFGRGQQYVSMVKIVN